MQKLYFANHPSKANGNFLYMGCLKPFFQTERMGQEKVSPAKKDVGSYSICPRYTFPMGTFAWKVSQILCAQSKQDKYKWYP